MCDAREASLNAPYPNHHHSSKPALLSTIITILTIGIQLGLTFITTVCIYMVFALFDFEGGFDNMVGLAIFQPILAIILSALTIIGCLLLGLPIRLIQSAKKWWIQHFYLAIGLTLVGLALLILSLVPEFMEEVAVTTGGFETTKKVPNGGLVVPGWLLTAFSLLHTYPPNRLTLAAQKVLTKLTGIK